LIAIIDYGVGNVFSLTSSMNYIGAETVVTSDPKEIEAADGILLPGVGAYSDAAKKLRDSGLADVIKAQAAKGKPLMGICLGMQLLFEKSYEYGEEDGLGLIPGKIVPIRDVAPAEYKIPHIGWNSLHFTRPDGKVSWKKNALFKYTEEGECVYFVHSFYATDCEKNTIAVTDYGARLTAAVANGNVYGCQFHPEKSGKTGLIILKAFVELVNAAKAERR